MKHLILISLVLGFSASISSCCSVKKSGKANVGTIVAISGAEVIIYKTTKDFSKFVPIHLSEDKKEIVSYPDIKDIFFNGKLAYPTMLHNGYLLDNRGINQNVAFIKLSYEEYSKLTATPSVQELFNMIIEVKPLLEMYSCGVRSSYNNIEKELNAKIDAGDFSSFIKLK